MVTCNEWIQATSCEKDYSYPELARYTVNPVPSLLPEQTPTRTPPVVYDMTSTV